MSKTVWIGDQFCCRIDHKGIATFHKDGRLMSPVVVADTLNAQAAEIDRLRERLERAEGLLRQLQLADDRKAEPVLRHDIDAFLAEREENTDGNR